MNKLRVGSYLLGLALLFGLLGGLWGSHLAFADQESRQAEILLPPAQEETPPTEPVAESLEVFSDYPILQSYFGTSFQFEVTLFYEGSAPRTFDLDLIAPEGWTGVFTGGYPETEISAFTVEPGKTGELIYLTINPAVDNLPEAGDYIFTVTASAENLAASVDLKAVVVPVPPQYLLYMSTTTLQSEFSVRPGQANHVSIQLTNAQIGTVKDIIFTAEGPEGWDITFTPATIAFLEPGVTQEIDVVIMPPDGTEAGDYLFTYTASGDKTETSRDIRITVVTATAMAGAGIGIAVAIIVGLVIWFRRAGRR
jgi:uncharacterized membrane protein